MTNAEAGTYRTVVSYKPQTQAGCWSEWIYGPYARNTDTAGITLGLSTWDSEDISAKVWRQSEEKWKRPSEELPLHRVSDLTILIL